MGEWPRYLDQLLFTALPYLAILTFLLVSIQRYRAQNFTFSSLSSQFLENRDHFWAMTPFHYGVLVVLGGHVAGFVAAPVLLWWNVMPLRLYFIEIIGLIFAVLTLIGLVGMIVRRIVHSKLRLVTTEVDAVLFLLLLIQVGSGIALAVIHPWGSSWGAAALSPYLWSIVKFNPDLSYVVGLPLLAKVHIVNAFVTIGFFPFTRMVHVLIVPNPYLWRKPQVARWNQKAESTD